MKKQGKEEGKTERQERMPLAERLAEYEKQNRISFHVPGHKGNSIFPEYGGISGLFPSGMLKADLTEIDGFDDLHHPHGIIQDAQHLAADLFGADETFFSGQRNDIGNYGGGSSCRLRGSSCSRLPGLP